MRALHFPQAVFWFEATFVSDQKEQELLPVAVDLHQGRQVRHLERLLDHAHLGESPWSPLPEARHGGLASAYPLARDRVVRTVAALANARVRELGERLDRQIARMTRYYADLRAEMEEQAERARARDEDTAKSAARREALDREERLRVAELRQKGTLRVHLRLTNLLVVHQPKLLIRATLARPRIGPDPPGTGLGPADRRAGGPRLPRMRPSDVRLRARPQGPPGLPLLRGLAPRPGQADAAMKRSRLDQAGSRRRANPPADRVAQPGLVDRLGPDAAGGEGRLLFAGRGPSRRWSTSGHVRRSGSWEDPGRPSSRRPGLSKQARST